MAYILRLVLLSFLLFIPQLSFAEWFFGPAGNKIYKCDNRLAASVDNTCEAWVAAGTSCSWNLSVNANNTAATCFQVVNGSNYGGNAGIWKVNICEPLAGTSAGAYKFNSGLSPDASPLSIITRGNLYCAANKCVAKGDGDFSTYPWNFGSGTNTLAFSGGGSKYTGAECSTSDVASTGSVSPPPGVVLPDPTTDPTKQCGTVNGVTVCFNAPSTTPSTTPTSSTSSTNTSTSSTTSTSTSTSSTTAGGSCTSNCGNTTNNTTTNNSTSSTANNNNTTSNTTNNITNNYGNGTSTGTVTTGGTSTSSTPGTGTTSTGGTPTPSTPGSSTGTGGTGTASSFGGSCGSVTCDGDAIQCAIARDQYQRNCAFFDTTTPESDLYNANKSRTGNITGDNPNNVSFSIGNLDQTNVLGGGSACITDKTVTVQGRSLTLPFSVVCPYLAMLGNVLLACSLLLAARIVTRG